MAVKSFAYILSWRNLRLLISGRKIAKVLGYSNHMALNTYFNKTWATSQLNDVEGQNLPDGNFDGSRLVSLKGGDAWYSYT
ncbi:hypothetical protein BH10PSE19_BH10PSE19_22910 [soil metagenome]